jgi:hypothetical protein
MGIQCNIPGALLWDAVNDHQRIERDCGGKGETWGELIPGKWALYVGDDFYGEVHAFTEEDALSRVAVFKMPFRAVRVRCGSVPGGGIPRV